VIAEPPLLEDRKPVDDESASRRNRESFEWHAAEAPALSMAGVTASLQLVLAARRAARLTPDS
jgi:hypothetical protein